MSLPRFGLSGGILRVSFIDYPNAFSPVVSQFLELPANNYAISFLPENQLVVEVRVHGIQIASCNEFHSDLSFDLRSFVPFRSSSWRVALANETSLAHFMLPQFDDSDWTSYTGGEWIQTNGQVWLLRTSFVAAEIPAGLGLYYQLQAGMRVYLNGHEVFSMNIPDTMTVRAHSKLYSALRAERAVLSSLWLRSGVLNVLAVAVTSLTPQSRLQLSLFAVSSPLSAIRPETIAFSSTVAVCGISNVVVLLARRTVIRSRVLLLQELRPSHRPPTPLPAGDQFPRARPREEHERHARRHSRHRRGRRRPVASRGLRPPPQPLRLPQRPLRTRFRRECSQRPFPPRYSQCVCCNCLI